MTAFTLEVMLTVAKKKRARCPTQEGAKKMIRAKTEVPAGSKALALGLLVAALMALSLMLTAKPAHAGTFTVTNTNDSGTGSLRQAILAANANPGADTIEFDLPDTENDNPVTGAEIISPLSVLPTITGAVTIDGYSQPGTSENTQSTGAIDAVILVELNGFNAGSRSGLTIEASNVVVRGLAINRFPGHGVEIESGTGARIEGNFIGTDSTGNLDRGNNAFGVQLDGGGKHVVGGTLPEARNLISGNNSIAIEISSNGTGGNRVQGNLMGTQRNAFTAIGGSAGGLFVETPNNTIGGSTPGTANVIAHNFGAGVEVFGAGNTGNRILGNSIHSNSGLGIELSLPGTFGRTLNDPKDPDKGPNNLQNFPVLTSFKTPEEGKIIIEGTLDSTPSTKKKKKRFTIQFFSNPQNEDGGKTFLGQTRVTTNKQGQASFSFETTTPLNTGDRITATATGPGGNTSEFSDPLPFLATE
jgi:Right handed beta helix region